MTNRLEAVFTDLDGSLFNSRKEISPLDRETIRKLKAQGIKVFLATGRHFSLFHQEAAQVGLEMPCIATNGAQYYDFQAGHSVKARVIPRETCVALQAYFESRRMPIAIYTDEQLFLTKPVSPTLAYCVAYQEQCQPAYRHPVGWVDEEFDIREHRVVQFMFQEGDRERAEEIGAALSALGQLSFFLSGNRCVDVTAAGVSKGAALLELAGLYGFSPENTLAMGDSHNDLSMLAACGVSVAPVNATDEVKSQVDFVSASCDESALTFALAKLYPGLL